MAKIFSWGMVVKLRYFNFLKMYYLKNIIIKNHLKIFGLLTITVEDPKISEKVEATLNLFYENGYNHQNTILYYVRSWLS